MNCRKYVKCQWCGKEFITYEFHIKNGRGKHCSKECCEAHRTKPVEELFWKKVDVRSPDECWLWKPESSGKYGHFRNTSAHRWAWILTNGPIADKRIQVCHNCPDGDNPKCCNPSHLFLGTSKENAEDRVKKGKQTHGEDVHWTKLNTAKVLEIRELYASGNHNQCEIAKMYGVAHSLISMITRREIWRHV